MISQLTIFLQNEKGHLASACSVIADADINMHALFLADTQEFGVARIFCEAPERAAEVLSNAGFRATVTPVCAIKLANTPGSLASLLKFCDDNDMNLEYGYCFNVSDTAIDVLKIDGNDVEEKLCAAGFEPISTEDIHALLRS